MRVPAKQKAAKRHPNLGSSLDELLAEDGIAAEVDAAARKRVAELRALPDGRPTADSPELGEDFFAEAKPTHEAIPGWPIRPSTAKPKRRAVRHR